MHLPLFVFGTLRTGECNHDLLANQHTSSVAATLPGFRRVATLMIAPDPTGTVAGELFALDPDGYDETLAECDALEGIPAGRTVGDFYRRSRVTVVVEGESVEAWAYTAANPEAYGPPTSS